MNPIDVLLNHKSIREFKPQRVPPAQLSVLLDVAQRAASSMCMQTYSIIRVVNPELKARLAEITGQEYVARMPELFIFIVDAYRNSRIAREQGVELASEADADRFFQGWTDACLAAQQMVAAAEMAGFGTVYLGSVLNDAPAVIELLGLPELTFPVVGLGLGVPDQRPALKPRLPRRNIVFDDAYEIFDDYLEEMEEYDEVMSEYTDLRNTSHCVDPFTKQVVRRLQDVVPNRQAILEQAEAQGFHFHTDAK